MSQTIFPALRYTDARAAVAWFETVFGAERHAVFDAADGSVAHAEMRIAGNIFMFGQDSVRDDYPVRSPKATNGVTASIYVVLPDAAAVDALHARAAAAGASITHAPNDTDYGSHDFSALDLDGHTWTFGTFDPNAAG
jgi:uncharacterized glyoxalase superfamily protein PhnB